MRDLNELSLNEGGEPVARPAPSQNDIQDFQDNFNIILPDDYVKLLNTANGGHPEVGAFTYIDGEGQSAVNRFYRLTADKEGLQEVWQSTEFLKKVLSQAGLNSHVVSIASTGGGDMIYLNMDTDPPSVQILYRSSGNSTPLIANSFAEFIDGLFLDPDLED